MSIDIVTALRQEAGKAQNIASASAIRTIRTCWHSSQSGSWKSPRDWNVMPEISATTQRYADQVPSPRALA